MNANGRLLSVIIPAHQAASMAGDLRKAAKRVAVHTDIGIDENQPVATRDLGAPVAGVGVRPEAFAYPFGHHGPKVADAVRRVYRSACTTELRFVEPFDPPG